MMEGFTQWLERLNEKMAIKSGIYVCDRVIALSKHLHHIEVMQMHDLAVSLREKLQKELEDLR